ncbi:hypothetical protein FRC10_010601 [Ceratobasidium sp. 414]|nr:hypothetical protein FRC10_010601 [Ceratobasidium sp. 414]
MAPLILGAVSGFLTIYIVNKWVAYRKVLAQINNQPGPRLLIAPYSYVPMIMDRFPPLLRIVSSRRFGGNLVGAEGADWKRQRRICAPAFSEKNNKLVWSTALGFTNDMIDTWEDGSVISVHDVCKDMTLPIALCVIAKAGYGQDVKWKNEEAPPAGHDFTFKQALLTVSDKIYLPLIMPNWAWGLRESWRYVKKANDELRLYIHEMITDRRELQDMASRSLAEEKHDIFNQIIHAHDDNDMMSEDELIGWFYYIVNAGPVADRLTKGNAFVFLIAGHETTAHSLVIALALLALYPEEQAKLAQEIQAAQPESRDFCRLTVVNQTYDDMPKIPYALAVLYETLRLYPMAPVIPKYATTNVTLTMNAPAPHTPATINVPESAQVSILARGLHYNPQHWDDPLDFYPARFMNPDWNRDAFIPFSVGPRSCIGRRFAETTVVASLTGLLSKYSVTVDETRFETIPSESIINRRERFFNFSYKITPSPQKVALLCIFLPSGSKSWMPCRTDIVTSYRCDSHHPLAISLTALYSIFMLELISPRASSSHPPTDGEVATRTAPARVHTRRKDQCCADDQVSDVAVQRVGADYMPDAQIRVVAPHGARYAYGRRGSNLAATLIIWCKHGRNAGFPPHPNCHCLRWVYPTAWDVSRPSEATQLGIPTERVNPGPPALRGSAGCVEPSLVRKRRNVPWYNRRVCGDVRQNRSVISNQLSGWPITELVWPCVYAWRAQNVLRRPRWWCVFNLPGFAYLSPVSYFTQYSHSLKALHLLLLSQMTSPSRLRSLFCECDKTPCQCWPASITPPAARPRTGSHSRPASASPSTLWSDYDPAQSRPSPHAPSGSHHEPNISPALPGYIPPVYYVAGALYPSPGSSPSKSPRPSQPELYGLLKAQSILRTPESPISLRLQWDVRDPPTEAVVFSGQEPEHLYEHPASVTYATSPPVPFMLIASSDALPWLVPVYAQAGSAGVTVGDIFRAIYDVLCTPVEESMPWLLPTDDDRARLHHAYYERISRNGDDPRGILAVDWLGEKTLFVCLGRDEALAKRRVADKEMWPHVYALKLKLRKGTLVSDV